MVSPGIYEADALTNDDYHAAEGYLSSSALKALLPERYTKPAGDSPALAFGTLVHAVILEPDTLTDVAVLDPHEVAGNNPKTGKPYDAPTMTNKWKEAVAEAQEAGRQIVSAEDWAAAHAMRDAALAHPVAAQLLDQTGARPEVSVFARDEQGLGHKARFDLLAPVAVDVKTTTSLPSAEELAKAATRYGYDLQNAHYAEVARLAGIDLEAFAFLFITKGEEPKVMVAELDEGFLARGRVLRALAIERATNPAAPRYVGADGFLTLTPPRWAALPEEIPA